MGHNDLLNHCFIIDFNIFLPKIVSLSCLTLLLMACAINLSGQTRGAARFDGGLKALFWKATSWTGSYLFLWHLIRQWIMSFYGHNGSTHLACPFQPHCHYPGAGPYSLVLLLEASPCLLTVSYPAILHAAGSMIFLKYGCHHVTLLLWLHVASRTKSKLLNTELKTCTLPALPRVPAKKGRLSLWKQWGLPRGFLSACAMCFAWGQGWLSPSPSSQRPAQLKSCK